MKTLVFAQVKPAFIILLSLFARLAFASDTGQLYAGMYPDDFWRNADILNGVAAWAGKQMTFSGTFIDAAEDTSNIVEKLEILVSNTKKSWLLIIVQMRET
jgi:hypothetical protein